MRSPPSGVHSRSNTRRSAVVSSIISYSSSWGNYSIVREGIRCHTDVAGLVDSENYSRCGVKAVRFRGGAAAEVGHELTRNRVHLATERCAAEVSPRWS